MTRAQAAWAYLTALFLIAGVTLCFLDTLTDVEGAGLTLATATCFTVAALGWIAILVMLVADREA